MRFLISLIIALFSLSCWADATPDQEYQLNTLMGPVAHKTQLGTAVRKTQTVVVGKYSFAIQGGASSAGLTPIYLLTNLNDKKSFVTIPAGAVITNVWINTITNRVAAPGTAYGLNSVGGLWGTGSASVAMSVLASGDLLAGRDASTAFYQMFAGVPVKGTTTTWVKIPASGTSKNVSISISNNPITSGKFNAYIEYMLGD